MRSSSDQRSSDAADQEPSEDIAVPVEQKFESPSTKEADQGVDEDIINKNIRKLRKKLRQINHLKKQSLKV